MLVSNTRTSADYNTRIVGGPDAIDQLATLGLIAPAGSAAAAPEAANAAPSPAAQR